MQDILDEVDSVSNRLSNLSEVHKLKKSLLCVADKLLDSEGITAQRSDAYETVEEFVVSTRCVSACSTNSSSSGGGGGSYNEWRSKLAMMSVS